MARTFMMGAKMTLKDNFKSPISSIARSTMDFKKTVDNTNKSVNTFKDSTGRLHNATGKYVAQGNKASVATRTWFNSNGKLSSSLSLVTRGLTAAAGAFGVMKASNWLVSANADMEQYKNTLTTVLKSEKKAVDTLAWASTFAAKTPFEIPQIVEATTRMSAYGINVQKTLGIVGDMASVMGRDVMQAVEAVADAQTGEMERLKEFGITKKMIQDQAKAMKVTVVNNKGQITDQKAFNAVLFKLMETRFKGGMEMQSKTLKGMISNFQDFVSSVGRTLGAPIFDAVKKGLRDVMAWLNKLQASGAIQSWAAQVQQLMGKVGAGINTYVVPAVKWLIANSKTIIGVFKTWGPIVLGLVAAFAAYQKTVAVVTAMTKAWAVVQAILNGTMLLNPIGLVIAAIVGLVAVGYVVVKNWTAISKFLIGIWEWIKSVAVGVWDGIAGACRSMWDGIVAAAKAPINFLIGAINTILRGINKMNITIPDWVPLLGGKKFGFNIPEIPYLAKGTNNWQGGPAYMNERGGELAILPGGSQVIPADKTDKVLDKPKGGNVTIKNYFEIHQQLGEDGESFATRVVTVLYDKLSNAAEIANTGEMGMLLGT